MIDEGQSGSGPKPTGINGFLVENGLLIKDNPAISPDMALDFTELLWEIKFELEPLKSLGGPSSAARIAGELSRLILWPKSMFSIGPAFFFLIESKSTGDCALITAADSIPAFEGTSDLSGGIKVIPLVWANCIKLKNAVLEADPSSTIFPRADERLKKTSLGIGARFTTLHWPAVAWAMQALKLPLTANQNSIPRELVFDVDALLEDRLANVPFPFIGGSVPEGHQGQSVMGMSHASIITLLKHGFHRHKIPWGFNADHQPVGGRFDAIEKELVAGSVFASYITFDLSPELSLHELLDDEVMLETAFASRVDAGVFGSVVKRLAGLGFGLSTGYIKKIVTFLMPAMNKMKRRDERYKEIRRTVFSTNEGRRFLRELSVDELPGETAPETLAVILALTEALGVTFDFIAPNIGFQKNIPYPDNAALRKKIKALYAVAGAFDMSIGFHSGSGKSFENYGIIGQETEKRFEVKTSGRYTYEMGVALSKSANPKDQKLWADWYGFTKDLAVTSAFSENATQKSFARDFINQSLATQGRGLDDGLYASAKSLRKTLDSLAPSPDHAFWFEYNFLFVLAAGGATNRLGDHSALGYKQRGRFYAISDQAKLLFAQRIVEYILFLSESTGIAEKGAIDNARKKIAGFREYKDLLEDI